MPNPVANAVFLPWVRQGAAAMIQTADTLATQAGSATLTAALTINGSGAPVSVPVRLLGPSDVVGLSQREIVRREPPPNTSAFEANHFAAIEFDRPDFPWLFTPARAGANARLRPWLCLIVVRKQEGVTLRPPVSTPLPTIEIASPARAADELPDLSDSWLWAHSQVAAGANAGANPDANALRNTLAGDPQLSLSRLLCPRLLAPDTEYIACLVPAFAAGRKAGLGLPVDSSEELAPAWSLSPADGAITLPLYDHWTFRTGSGGDFKTLAKLLKPQPAPQGLGKRPMSIAEPGFALPGTFPADAKLDLEGALQPLQSGHDLPWPDGTAEPFQTALATIVNATGATPSTDPLLTPPLYGSWHADRQSVQRTPPSKAWFDELNLDPRHRAVAAFGTRVVQEHQEALMASAWQQAGDLQAVNQRMRQLQLAAYVGESLHARHFERMETETLLRVAAPALTRIRAPAVPGKVATMVTAFADAAMPLRAVGPSMRKLSRARGPLNRRVQSVANISNGMSRLVSGLNVATTLSFTVAPAPSMLTFDVFKLRGNQPGLLRYQQVTHAAVAAMPGAPQFQLMPEGVRIRMPVEGTRVALVDNAVAVAFRAAARQHLQKLNPARATSDAPRLLTALDLTATGAIRSQLRVQMQPRTRAIALTHTIVAMEASTPPDSATPVSTLLHEPKFPQPMYEPLRDLSQELLLPGLNSVAPNAVIGLRTNQRFVNAYMVGLNSEMGHELLWRGFPTDQRGTYFDKFWDTASASTPQADIDPIQQWGTRALSGSAGTADGKFVMLLRSELLRRYPTASIYAVPAVIQQGQRVPDADASHEVHPAFRGSLPPDVTFIGFDLTVQQVVGGAGAGQGYFIVIQEQPTEPRFGLDDGIAPSGRTHLPTVSGPPAGLQLRGLQWRQNAAHMAGILRRQPVRIAIHASQFISTQAL